MKGPLIWRFPGSLQGWVTAEMACVSSDSSRMQHFTPTAGHSLQQLSSGHTTVVCRFFPKALSRAVTGACVSGGRGEPVNLLPSSLHSPEGARTEQMNPHLFSELCNGNKLPGELFHLVFLLLSLSHLQSFPYSSPTLLLFILKIICSSVPPRTRILSTCLPVKASPLSPFFPRLFLKECGTFPPPY